MTAANKNPKIVRFQEFPGVKQKEHSRRNLDSNEVDMKIERTFGIPNVKGKSEQWISLFSEMNNDHGTFEAKRPIVFVAKMFRKSAGVAFEKHTYYPTRRYPVVEIVDTFVGRYDIPRLVNVFLRKASPEEIQEAAKESLDAEIRLLGLDGNSGVEEVDNAVRFGIRQEDFAEQVPTIEGELERLAKLSSYILLGETEDADASAFEPLLEANHTYFLRTSELVIQYVSQIAHPDGRVEEFTIDKVHREAPEFWKAEVRSRERGAEPVEWKRAGKTFTKYEMTPLVESEGLRFTRFRYDPKTQRENREIGDVLHGKYDLDRVYRIIDGNGSDEDIELFAREIVQSAIDTNRKIESESSRERVNRFAKARKQAKKIANWNKRNGS